MNTYAIFLTVTYIIGMIGNLGVACLGKDKEILRVNPRRKAFINLICMGIGFAIFLGAIGIY